jgi:plasmid stability protein
VQTKRLPLILPSDLYQRLQERAQRNDRDVLQEARRILREALEKPEKEQPRAN